MPIERRGAFGYTYGRSGIMSILQICTDNHAPSVETIGKTAGRTVLHASSRQILGVNLRNGSRAGMVADQVVAIVIRSGGALGYTQASAIVSQQGRRAGCLAISGDVVGVPARQALVDAAIGSVVSVQVGGEVGGCRTSYLASLVGEVLVLRLTVLSALVGGQKGIVIS
jgi:hypothetical protein